MRILWTSDQHTLHKRTPTPHILGNLTKFLVTDHDLAKTDMVLFGGDFMEDQVDFPNTDAQRVLRWGSEFLDQAHEANPDMIAVWLEGTSSHDRGQPKHFLSVAPKGMDVRYVDTLCIHVYEKLDNLSIMYVPDNMGTMTTDAIWELALKVLKDNSMDQVDIIALHGGFDFQLHSAARHKGHLLERWETITRHVILAGHIHTPVQKGKLHTSGSFDRVAHGEEHPKGGLVVTLDKASEKCEVEFYENKNALPYLTMETTPDVEPGALATKIVEFIRSKKMPPFSQLKIRGGTSTVVNPVVDVLSKEFPMIGFMTDNEANKDHLLEDEIYEQQEYEGVTLNRENLAASLTPEVEEEFKALGIPMEEAYAVLEEFLCAP